MEANNATVYVAVRLDMPLHQQIVQVGHASFNAGKHFGSGQDDDSPNMVVVGVADEEALTMLAAKVQAKARIAVFSEPEDFGQGEDTQKTAFATEPVGRNQGRKLFWGVPLWSFEQAKAA